MSYTINSPEEERFGHEAWASSLPLLHRNLNSRWQGRKSCWDSKSGRLAHRSCRQPLACWDSSGQSDCRQTSGWHHRVDRWHSASGHTHQIDGMVGGGGFAVGVDERLESERLVDRNRARVDWGDCSSCHRLGPSCVRATQFYVVADGRW